MSSSLLLQWCLAFLVHLIRTILEMGSGWVYSCRFEGCCFQDLFNTARSILLQMLSSFFSMAHLYSSTHTTSAWKKLHFTLSDSADFHMSNNLEIAVHTFACHVLMSFFCRCCFQGR